MANMETRDTIHRMIGASVRTAARLSGRDATVSGILSGLRHLRDVVVLQGGEDAARIFDDQVRGHILGQLLSTMKGAPEPITVVLPKVVELESRAGAIMRDVSESCLVLNSVTRDEGVFTHTLTGLLDQLMDQLGGMPKWSELEDALKTAEPSWTWETSPIKGDVTLH
ncbi:MAG: hypothetical protein JXQ84_10485 [Rhodospirillaceae bacterium]|nr:hypothetical protein [Rhodospirillaceae bacterium]